MEQDVQCRNSNGMRRSSWSILYWTISLLVLPSTAIALAGEDVSISVIKEDAKVVIENSEKYYEYRTPCNLHITDSEFISVYASNSRLRYNVRDSKPIQLVHEGSLWWQLDDKKVLVGASIDGSNSENIFKTKPKIGSSIWISLNFFHDGVPDEIITAMNAAGSSGLEVGIPVDKDLEGLRKVRSLRSLWVRSGDELASLDGLYLLTGVEDLKLENCKMLVDLRPFKQLPTLRSLKIRTHLINRREADAPRRTTASRRSRQAVSSGDTAVETNEDAVVRRKQMPAPIYEMSS